MILCFPFHFSELIFKKKCFRLDLCLCKDSSRSYPWFAAKVYVFKDLFFRQTQCIFRYRSTDTIVTSKHEVIENEITVVGIFGDIAMTATVEKLDWTTGLDLMGSLLFSHDCCNFSPKSFSNLSKTTGYLEKLNWEIWNFKISITGIKEEVHWKAALGCVLAQLYSTEKVPSYALWSKWSDEVQKMNAPWIWIFLQ